MCKQLPIVTLCLCGLYISTDHIKRCHGHAPVSLQRSRVLSVPRSRRCCFLSPSPEPHMSVMWIGSGTSFGTTADAVSASWTARRRNGSSVTRPDCGMTLTPTTAQVRHHLGPHTRHQQLVTCSKVNIKVRSYIAQYSILRTDQHFLKGGPRQRALRSQRSLLTLCSIIRYIQYYHVSVILYICIVVCCLTQVYCLK